jgi:putative ubiquitin-RnfH superfamily antitoxin RatB of RatAB toxin-antitoxin module
MISSAIEVSVVFALPLEADVVTLNVPPGTTAEQAIRLSGVLDRHPEIDLQRGRIGIFGRWAALDTPLQAGDRVEIYRALSADPKEVRRLRARG